MSRARRSGVALMLAATAAFSAMFALVKALGPAFPYPEAVLFRSLLSVPVVLRILARSGHGLRPRRPVLMGLRGLFGLSAMSAYFYSLQRGKLADVTVIGRLQPVLVALLAPLLLRERAPREAVAALVLSFAGVLLVIRPGLGFLNIPGLTALLAALMSALAHVTVRRLSATEPPERIVVWFTLIIGLGGGLASIPVFQAPSPTEWLLLAGIASLATTGQLLMTTAYSRDTAPVIAAASYSSVAYTLVLGMVFWGELPDPPALLGGAIIVAAGIYLAAVRARRQAKITGPPRK